MLSSEWCTYSLQGRENVRMRWLSEFTLVLFSASLDANEWQRFTYILTCQFTINCDDPEGDTADGANFVKRHDRKSLGSPKI
jgi:hypothetical protein